MPVIAEPNGVPRPENRTLNDQLPWRIEINPITTPTAQTNWDNISVQNTQVIGRKYSGGSQNNAIGWDAVIPAGTWTLEILHDTGNDRGIFTVALDDGAGTFTTLGTIDTYSASNVWNVRASLTGIVVASTVKRRLRITMATKNASSSAYTGVVSWLTLRRTA